MTCRSSPGQGAPRLPHRGRQGAALGTEGLHRTARRRPRRFDPGEALPPRATSQDAPPPTPRRSITEPPGTCPSIKPAKPCATPRASSPPPAPTAPTWGPTPNDYSTNPALDQDAPDTRGSPLTKSGKLASPNVDGQIGEPSPPRAHPCDHADQDVVCERPTLHPWFSQMGHTYGYRPRAVGRARR
jgi:hypothetical protein